MQTKALREICECLGVVVCIVGSCTAGGSSSSSSATQELRYLQIRTAPGHHGSLRG